MNPIITRRPNKNEVIAFIQGNPSVFEIGENETVAVCKLLLRLQGKPVQTVNGSWWLAAGCWTSVFVMAWMMIGKYIESGFMAWFLFFFFFVVGLCAGAFAMRR